MFTKILLIKCEKLTATANYSIWAASAKLWFQGQGWEYNLTKQSKDIATVHRIKWKQVDAFLCLRIPRILPPFTAPWFSNMPNLQHNTKLSPLNDVLEKAKKVYSNNVHYVYSVTVSFLVSTL